MRHVLVPLAIIAAFATAVAACIWDSDSMRTEAEGLPGVAEAITGHFVRFPPEYFQRRIEIATARIDADPDDLAAYDDLAVAHDRLGRYVAAFDWMERKHAAIGRLTAAGRDVADHQYRYHANLGTFHAHAYIAAPLDERDERDIQLAETHIARAIEINPDAHFGREKYQLAAIRWIADLPGNEREFSYTRQPMFLSMLDDDGLVLRDAASRDEAIEGLVGLIVLGAAWESIDVYTALAELLYRRRDASLGYAATLRVRELIDSGRRSLHPDYDHAAALEHGAETLVNPSAARLDYAGARASAREWHAEHTAFVLARLAEGQHPDLHEAALAAAPKPVLVLPHRVAGVGPKLWTAGIVLALISLAVAYLIHRRFRTRRAAPMPA